jgi:plasmid stabilization system protein ParE
MKVEWSDDALADLDRFATFLRETYPTLAERVARELVSRAQMLSELPRSGRALAGCQDTGSSSCAFSMRATCSNIAMPGIGS